MTQLAIQNTLFFSLLSAEAYRKTKKKRKKADPSDDSHEDDESSVIQSAKINNRINARSRSSGRLSSNKSVMNPFKKNNVLAIKNTVNDANNNKTLKVRFKLMLYIQRENHVVAVIFVIKSFFA